VYFEDAKSYFARHQRRYDVIMAEPSNPWVNGVSSLFTTEFYRDTRRYLAPGGLFVQWVQGYEFNDRLMASVLQAVGENFADYKIYESNDGDLVIVAVAEGRVPLPGPLPEKESALVAELARLGITRADEISARSVAGKRQIDALLPALSSRANSDFYPVVQLEAPRARFVGSLAGGIQDLATAPLPVLQMVGGEPFSYLSKAAAWSDPSLRIRQQSTALEIVRLLSDRSADPLRSSQPAATEVALTLRIPEVLCGNDPSSIAIDRLQTAAEKTLGGLAPERAQAFWKGRKWLGCTPRSAHVRDRLEIYSAVAARDAKTMLSRARALLEGPPTGGDSWGRYLLGTALLGAVASGDRQEAVRLWNTYGGKLYPSGDVPLYVYYLLESS